MYIWIKKIIKLMRHTVTRPQIAKPPKYEFYNKLEPMMKNTYPNTNTYLYNL